MAPDSFKGTASATEVARALAGGWREVRPDDDVIEMPLADGGEGTLDALANATSGARWHQVVVVGPDSRQVTAHWLALPDGTAVAELAQSSGLPQMAQPEPLGSHTFGLGEVISAILNSGARRLLVGLGGSASTDGGTGALTALGARFLDRDGTPLKLGGGTLVDLDQVDLSGLRPGRRTGCCC